MIGRDKYTAQKDSSGTSQAKISPGDILSTSVW